MGHPEQLEEVLWSLTMLSGLRELLLEVMNFVVSADHLKVGGGREEGGSGGRKGGGVSWDVWSGIAVWLVAAVQCGPP